MGGGIFLNILLVCYAHSLPTSLLIYNTYVYIAVYVHVCRADVYVYTYKYRCEAYIWHTPIFLVHVHVC